LEHSTYIKYALLGLVFFFMIISIRTYLNYVAIDDAILEVKNHMSETTDEFLFTEKFLIAYLSSDYADYFFTHENNILHPWEFIIKFEEESVKTLKVQSNSGFMEKSKNIDLPKNSWNYFLREKWLENRG